MIFIDTTHCRLAPDEPSTIKQVIVIGAACCLMVALAAFGTGVNYKKKKRGYEQVSIEDVERTSLCRVTKMCKKKLCKRNDYIQSATCAYLHNYHKSVIAAQTTKLLVQFCGH